MDWQTIVAVAMFVVALVYVLLTFRRQLSKPEVDPKCDNCPVPDLHRQHSQKSD